MYLAVVSPLWGFSPTGRDGWVMADLFRHVPVFLVDPYILERLALEFATKGINEADAENTR